MFAFDFIFALLFGNIFDIESLKNESLPWMSGTAAFQVKQAILAHNFGKVQQKNCRHRTNIPIRSLPKHISDGLFIPDLSTCFDLLVTPLIVGGVTFSQKEQGQQEANNDSDGNLRFNEDLIELQEQQRE
jgi:hypothetical protein